MKSFLSLSVFLFSFVFANAQSKNFNQKLADSLAADAYGMRTYYLVILKTGKTEITDKTQMGKLMKGHLSNIKKLAAENKLIIAGPMLEDNPNHYEGIFILNVKTKEDAENLVSTDPAVKAGVFDIEYYKWYGSAALPLYLKFHEKITKQSF